MLNRYDLGSQVSDIIYRVSSLEQGRLLPVTIFDDLVILKKFRIDFGKYEDPYSILFSDNTGNISKRHLGSLINDVPYQTSVIDNNDGTISVNLPQDIASVSTPTFSGLNLLGNLTTTGNIDGVDIALLYNNATTHINNSTTAHFGQDLRTIGSPQFSNLNITGNINILGTVDGIDISDFYIDYDLHKNNTSIHFTEASIDHANIQNIGFHSHSAIDEHIDNTTTAHFGQNLSSSGIPTFTQVNVSGNPTFTSNVTSKSYVDGIAQGIIWQKEVLEYYDPSGGLPIAPSVGDRYLSYTTANDWTTGYIYEWDGLLWTEIIPSDRYAIFIRGGSIHPTDLFVFNGSEWCQFGTTMNHETLFNIGINTHSQIDTHIGNNSIHFTEASIDHNNIQNIGSKTHATIDAHIDNNTTAHFNQDLKASAKPTFYQVTLSVQPTLNNDVATKAYVDGKSSSASIRRSVISIYNPSSGLPSGPSEGNSYISSATANGWIINSIYTWINSSWSESIPTLGEIIYVANGSIYTTYEVFFNGTTWIPFGETIDHTNLKNIGTNTHNQIDSHIADTTIHFTESSINHQNIMGSGTYSHSAIDSHINNITNAHFGQDLKSTAAPTFSSVIVAAQPTLSTQLANKAYVDAKAQGIVWQNPVIAIYDPTGGLPISPNVGDRYISYVSASGWTKDYIYEWNGSIWNQTIPQSGFAIYVQGGSYFANKLLMYENGTGWFEFNLAMDHLSLLNIGTKTHAQIDSHINDTTIHYTVGSIDHTLIQNVGTNTHTEIDSHISNSTTAHFGQDLQSTASPTFVDVNITNDPTNDTHAIRKVYYDNKMKALQWQTAVLEIYDPSGGIPNTPALGDRYISSSTANGWVEKHIYEWNNSIWMHITPSDGFITWVIGGLVSAQRYIYYETSAGWTELSTNIDHTKLLNRGTYTHATIDSHLNNTTTAHFGQDLKSTATPSFNQISVTHEPTIGNHVATKLYVDDAIQTINGGQAVKSFYDTSGGLPPTPSVGDSYISMTTASSWIKDRIYTYTLSGWAEFIPMEGYRTYVQEGSIHPDEVVIYKSAIDGWRELAEVINHLNLKNVGTNTHAEIDSHISNSTTAHFGQDLKSTGTPTFASSVLTSTELSSSTTTGALQVVGGAGLGSLYVANTTKLNGNLTMGINDIVSVGKITSSENIITTLTETSSSTSTGALRIAGGAGIRSLYVANTTVLNGSLTMGTNDIVSVGKITSSKNIITNLTVISSSTSTGALQVVGGAGLGSLYVAGTSTLNNATVLNGNLTMGSNSIVSVGKINSIENIITILTETSSSTTTGALQVAGGAGMGSLYIVGTSTLNDATVLNGSLTMGTNDIISVGKITSSENIITTLTETSSSTTTGSLQVAGGAGIGSLFVANTTKLNGNLILGTNDIVSVGSVSSSSNLITTLTETASSTSTGSLRIAGGAGLGSLYVADTTVLNGNLTMGTNDIASVGKITSSENIITTLTETSSSTSTGALRVVGGAGIGSLYVASSSTLNANTVLNGNLTMGTNDIVSVGKIISSENIITNLTETSSSTSTGALQIVGGAGLGSLYVSGVSTLNGASVLNGSLTMGSNDIVSVGKITSSENIITTLTENTTSTSTGALQISGGAGLGSLYVEGSTKLNSAMELNGSLTMGTNNVASVGSITSSSNLITTLTETSSSTSTGALRVYGGAGLGSLYVNSSSTLNGASVLNGSLTMGTNDIVSVGKITSSENIITTLTENTSSTSTGALRVVGGAGMGSLYVAGLTTLNSAMVLNGSLTMGTNDIASVGTLLSSENIITTLTETSSSTSTGALRVYGGAGLGSLYVAGSSTLNSATVLNGSLTMGINDIVSVGKITSSENIITTLTENTSSTSTGALQVAGGAGLGSLYVEGSTTLNSAMVLNGSLTMGTNDIDTSGKINSSGYIITTLTETSSSTSTGALRVYGGAGLGSLYVADNGVIDGTLYVTSTSTLGGATVLNGSLTMGTNDIVSVGTITSSENIITTSTETSTSTSTGALRIAGGAGIGSLYVAGTSTLEGATVLNGGLNISSGNLTMGTNDIVSVGKITSSKNIITTLTETSSSTSTGALRVVGGAGLGSLYVAGNSSLSGTFNVSSTSTLGGATVLNGNLTMGTNNIVSVGSITSSSHLITTLTETSSSTSTGALRISGGAGLGSLYVVGASTLVGNATLSGTLNIASTSTLGGATVLNGNLTMGTNNIVSVGAITSSKNIITTLTETSSSTSTGALRIAGGAGLGNLFVEGLTTLNSAVALNGNLTMGTNDIATAGKITSSENIITTLTETSSSTSTGALRIAGGAGLGSLYVEGTSTLVGNASLSGTLNVSSTSTLGGATVLNGNLTMGTNDIVSVGTITSSENIIINNTETSSSISTGSLRIAGGAGVGSLYVANNSVIDGSLHVASTSTLGGATVLNGSLTMGTNDIVSVGKITSSENIITTLTETSSSTSTGALRIAGGAGLGSLYVVNNGVIDGTLKVASTSTLGGATVLNGSLTMGTNDIVSVGKITSSENITTTLTETSSSTSTGSLRIAGGAGIGSLYVAGASTLVGNATLSGTLNIASTSTLGGATVLNGSLTMGTNDIVSVGKITSSENIITTLTEASSSTSTGALRIAGGAGLGNLFVEGLTTLNSAVVLNGNLTMEANDIITAGKITSSENIITTLTETSSSTSTGALQVAGGAGVGSLYVNNSLFVEGLTTLNSAIVLNGTLTMGTNDIVTAGKITSSENIITTLTETSSSTSTGALQVAGGAGMGTLYVSSTSTLGGATVLNGNLTMGTNDIVSVGAISTTGIIVLNNTDDTSSTSTGALQVYGGVNINKSLIAYGDTILYSTTLSNDSTTGSLVVHGGVGINGDVNVSDNMYVTGILESGSGSMASLVLSATTNTTSINTGALKISGGTGVAKNLYVGGETRIQITSGTSSTSTGALQVVGGAGLGSLYVAGRTTLVGNASVSGTLNVLSTSTLGGATVLNGSLTMGTNDIVSVGKITSSDNVSITLTEGSTSTTSGALRIAGGAGIGSLYVAERTTTGGVTSSDLILKNNTNNVTITAHSSLATNYGLQLPTTLPTGAVSSLVSDASGNFSWNNQMFISDNIKIVSKTPGVGEFASIEAAITACTSPADTNRYLIQVQAGKYAENELTVPSYVYITGIVAESVIITTNGDHDLFNMSENTALYQLRIDGVPQIAISVVDCGFYVQISKVFISYCGTAIYCKAETVDSQVFFDSVDTMYSTNYEMLIDTSTKQMFVSLFTVTLETMTGYSPIALEVRSGGHLVGNVIMLMGDTPTGHGTGLKVYGGSAVLFGGFTVYNYNLAIDIPTDTTMTTVEISSGNLYTNVADINVSNVNATGYYFGIVDRKNTTIVSDSSFYIYNKYTSVINVAKSGGDYTSVKEAVDSVTDASIMKPYIIQVYPGTYIEDPFTMKNDVNVIGVNDSATLQPSTTNSHFITFSSTSTLHGITLSGQLGSADYALIYCPGNNISSFSTGIVEKCKFSDTETCIIETTENGSARMKIISCDFVDSTSIKYFYRITSTAPDKASCYINGLTVSIEGSSIVNFLEAYGERTLLLFANGTVNNVFQTGNFLSASNGATISVSNTQTYSFNNVIYVPNVGLGPILNIEMTVNTSGTYDAYILNNATSGAIFSNMIVSKISSVSNNIQYLFRNVDGLTVVGNLYFGDTLDDIVNITYAAKYSTNLGVINGGVCTMSGLDVTITAGSGYITIGTIPNDLLKYILWVEQTITLDANSYNYVYINSSGTAIASPTKPNATDSILLEAIYTGASASIYNQFLANDVHYTATEAEQVNKIAFGPIVSSGILATASATALKLDITSGVYYYGNNKYISLSGTDITFYTFYRNGSGGWTRNSTDVVEEKYDDNSGTLQTITLGNYVKHALYSTGSPDGTTSVYLLIYGQEQFTSEAEAISGNMPVPPSFISDATISVAGIVVYRPTVGDVTITTTIDTRPTIAFKSGGQTATADHNSLSNLTVGDAHTQYVRTDGTRVMGGSLKLGGNDITGLGNVYDNTSPTPKMMNIFAHASRHGLSGDDPLEVGTPVNIGTINSAGVSNTYIRSDHVHAHGNQTSGTLHAIVTQSVNGFMSSTDKTKLDNATATNTVSTLVIRDASGNFSGNVITVESTTAATNSLTGALIVKGGIGITKTLHVGGMTHIMYTENATNTTTGSLMVSGGAAIANNLFIGGTMNVTGDLRASNGIFISTVNSTNISSGALQVNGGIGVNNDAYIGGMLNILNSNGSSSTTTGALRVAGGAGLGSLYVAGNAVFNDTTTAPTQTYRDNSTKVATTAYVDNSLLTQNVVMHAPTGFENTTDSIMTYDSTTRVFTIAPAVASFNVWVAGIRYTISSPIVMPPHDNTPGSKHYYYFNSSGVLTMTQTFPEFYDNGIASFIYYYSEEVYLFTEERHGIVMDQATHYELHFTIGTYYVSGLDATDYTINPVVPTDTHNTFSITTGIISDEQLNSTITAIPASGPYTIMYITGSSALATWTSNNIVPYHYETDSYIRYNQNNGGTWQLTTLSDNKWVNYYVCFLPSLEVEKQCLIVPGQTVYNELADARGENFYNLSKGTIPFPEFLSLYQITFRTSSTYNNSGKCRIEAWTHINANRISTTNYAITNHQSLSGLQLAASGVTYGHINDQPQTIEGIKTFSDTMNATSTDTGGVIISGGMGIKKDLYIGQHMNVLSTEISSSTSTGALRISGGAGLGSLYVVGTSTLVGNASLSGTLNVLSTATLGGATVLNGSLTMGVNDIISVGTITSSKNIITTLTETSSSISTGALRIAGGAGLGSLYVANNGVIGGTLNVSSTSTLGGATVLNGSLTMGVNDIVSVGTITSSENIITTLTETSTSTSTGALRIAGGAGLGSLYVANNGVIDGTLKISSTSTLGGATVLNGSLTMGTNDIVSVGTITSSKEIITASTETSSSTSTGALRIAGGAGLGSLYVANNGIIDGTLKIASTSTLGGATVLNGSLTMGTNDIVSVGTITSSKEIITASTETSSSTTTGALRIAGGAGLGSLYVANNGIIDGTLNVASLSTLGGATVLNGSLTMGTNDIVSVGTITSSENIITTLTETSSSTSTGALRVAGGAGLGSLYVANNGVIDGTLKIASTSTLGGATVLNGSLTMGTNDIVSVGTITSSENIITTLTETSSSTSTGALRVYGGAGIGSLYVAGTSTLVGNASLSGTLNVVSTSTFGGATVLNGSLTMGVNDIVSVGKITSSENIITTFTETSTSTSTGALRIAGGAGLGSLYVANNGVINGTLKVASLSTLEGATVLNGSLTMGVNDIVSVGTITSSENIITTLTETSSSISTGALRIAGGAGLGSLYVENNGVIDGTLNVSSTSTLGGATVLNGSLTMGTNDIVSVGTITSSENIIITLTESSSSTSTGALRVYGGAGVGSLYVSGTSTLSGTLNVSSTATLGGATVLNGSLTMGTNDIISVGTITSSENIITTLTETSSSTTTGALRISGGAGVGSLYVAGTSTLTGNASLSGTLNVASTTTLGGATVLNGSLTMGTNNITSIGSITASSNLITTLTETSSSTSTGALRIVGGAGLGSLYVSGLSTLNGATVLNGNLTMGTNNITSVGSITASSNLITTLTETSSSTSTGALRIVGGAGLGSLYVSGSSTLNGASVLNGNLTMGTNNIASVGSITASNHIIITLTETSSSTSTGALRVAGGAGLESLYVSGLSTLNGASVLNGNLTMGTNNIASVGSIMASSNLIITLTETSSSTSTGALRIVGGAGLGSLYVSGSSTLNGASVLNGNLTMGTNNIASVGSIMASDHIISTLTETASSTSTGALSIAGGAGLGSLYVSGSSTLNGASVLNGNLTMGTNNIASVGSITASSNLTTTLTETASSTSTGALRIAGGAGLGSLYVAGSSTLNGTSVLNGSLAMGTNNITSVGSITASSNLITTLTETSSSTSTGALRIAGGAGIGSLYVSGLSTLNGASVLNGSLTMGTNNITSVGSITASSNLTTTLTETSSSTSTGALRIAGGAGLGSLYVAGSSTLNGSLAMGTNNITSVGSMTASSNLITTLTETSSSTSTGALRIAGGAGVGSLYVNSLSTLNGATVLNGSLTMGTNNITSVGSITATSNLITTLTETSSSTSTGALRIAGGAGVGSLYVNSLSTLNGASVLNGSLTMGTNNITSVGSITASSNLITTLTETSSSTSTGALRIAGGAGLGSLYVNSLSTLNGATVLNGNLTMGTNNITSIGSITASSRLITTLTETSSSTSTGALRVLGGASLGSLYVDNNAVVVGTLYTDVIAKESNASTGVIFNSGSIVYINDTTNAVALNSGALQVSGGGSISKTLYAQTVIPTNLTMTNNVTFIDTDTTLAAASNTYLATELAIKTYVDARYVHVWTLIDSKTLGTTGGTPVASTWTARTLNTITTDSDTADTSVTLASDIITLTAGHYLIQAEAPFLQTTNTKLRIATPIPTPTTFYYGSNSYGTPNTVQILATVSAQINIVATTTYQLQYWASTSNANGLGRALSITGVPEQYSKVTIIKFNNL